MSRSVELGRAVLAVPTINHELWLTTLITILPEQNATYLAQLTPVKCLEFLSSGVPWVHRGNDMHMDLRINLYNEALPCAQLQDLTNAVLRAPIWNQLMLRPSFPARDIADPGTVRLDIGHAVTDGRETEQKRHRLFSNVPASDVRPPDRVVSVALQSIHLSMDILETIPLRRPIPRRSNSYPSRQEAAKPEVGDTATTLFDPESTEDSPHCDALKPTVLALNRKRKRPVIHTPPNHLPLSDRALSQTDLRTMVESALRLTIRGTVNKPHNSCKIKASTFRSGLADIAPALWRGGFLDALYQRAQLMPTITQSLFQTVFVKSMSISLKCKMESISDVMRMNQQAKDREQEYEIQPCVTRTKSSIAAQLWNHSQKILLQDPVPPTQACVASDLEQLDSDSDDMLAEEHDEWFENMPKFNDGDNVLSNSSGTIDDGCTLPPTMSTTNSDKHSVQTYQQSSGKPILGTDPLEFDEELLFDSSLQRVVSTSDTP
ncbi:hypothetical protein yc1106_03972 [Curvularia clavata]|uniref:Uncharacterized protein n=1 Tax=Curvularia clavata TaxID=95742 RepID=A0A9Q8ZAB3_CURCL|nr:hypothetical protein yc1106_03972 [Curvularia clavata]